MSSDLSLNKTLSDKKFKVAIYGDDEDKTISKMLWQLMPHQRVEMAPVDSIEDLEKEAPESALIFIIINDENDPNRHLGSLLMRNRNVVCSAIALTRDADIKKQTGILASGFDAIFNVEYLKTPEMKAVINNQVEKGIIRQNNKSQQEEYQRFKASLSASPDAFVVFDENRKLFFVSEHYLRAYPEQAGKLKRGVDVMEAFDYLYKEHEDAKFVDDLEDLRNFWERMEGQREFKLGDGRVWRMKAAKLAYGLGTIVTTTDITHYKEQQKKLEKQSKELEEALQKEKEASEIQKQFINMVSHEFRTPLTIIDGNTQLLINRFDQFDKEKIIDKLRIVRSAVSRLVSMLEGVLSSNMLKTGQFTLSPSTCDVKQMIEDISKEHGDISKNAEIIVDTKKAPEKATLDRKTVALVMSNLLSNAIKFSPDNGEIAVRCTEEGAFVCITVRDNGIGIPENEIDNIFRRYYRSTTASGIPGSGIGLDMVKSLVDLHEGRIEVASQRGEGTEIKVFLKKME